MHGLLENTDAIILCGGQGERLRPVIKNQPKVLAEINGKAFLDILIENLYRYGTKRIILSVGYLKEQIIEHFNHRDNIEFSEEDKPLGTGGAVKNAEGFIQSSPCLVINGDSFCWVDIEQFFDFHLRKGGLLSMVVAEACDTKDYGTIFLNDSQRVIQFKEKAGKEKAYINAGIYLFEKEIFSLIPQETKYSLEYDLFPKLAGKEFYGYVTQEKLIDIGTPQRYEEGKRLFSQ